MYWPHEVSNISEENIAGHVPFYVIFYVCGVVLTSVIRLNLFGLFQFMFLTFIKFPQITACVHVHYFVCSDTCTLVKYGREVDV